MIVSFPTYLYENPQRDRFVVLLGVLVLLEEIVSIVQNVEHRRTDTIKGLVGKHRKTVRAPFSTHSNHRAWSGRRSNSASWCRRAARRSASGRWGFGWDRRPGSSAGGHGWPCPCPRPAGIPAPGCCGRTPGGPGRKIAGCPRFSPRTLPPLPIPPGPPGRGQRGSHLPRPPCSGSGGHKSGRPSHGTAGRRVLTLCGQIPRRVFPPGCAWARRSDKTALPGRPSRCGGWNGRGFWTSP